MGCDVQLILVALGLAQTCTRGGSTLSISQASEILGKNARAFLMVIRAGAKDREKFIPGAGAGPGGDVDFYAIYRLKLRLPIFSWRLAFHP